MINMQQYGAADAWNALLYPQANPQTVNFLYNQFEQARGMVLDSSRAFVEQAQRAFDHRNSSAAVSFARRVAQTVQGVFETNHVVELRTLQDFQNASLVMQRYLAANPYIRAQYQQQTCDGWADTYVDTDPGTIGDTHYDYRRVMEGMLITQDDGSWIYKTYFDDLKDNDRPLILEEQRAILYSWDYQKHLHALGVDDTTASGGGQL